MNISPFLNLKPENIEYLNPYATIYLCMKKVAMQDVAGAEISKNLCDILENIKKYEAQNLYLKEIAKIQEFLLHNKTAEVPYCSADMLKVRLSTGKMCKTTVQMLIENCGLSEYELTEFMETLHFKIQEDVNFLYEEIERNLDRKYRVHYDELY